MAQNIGKLAGKTVFITGASRGIGKAIALKVAKDGANVVIAAKTTDPHPKLPGTIYTVAKEIEAAGGRCLPCVVDVRNEDQVKSAVETAVKHFGGIDILINNASAIGLTSTSDTDMKKYDLMHNINTRGTFITSKYCIPHLQRSQNPHILTLSPPLNMNPRWFKDNLAYTMAKYGMSMCVLGMAEEFREDGIAVNALWPKTSIATAAVGMLGGQYMMEISRTPEIMSDAAYVILCKDSRTFSGNFAIDEGVLREAGVTDFDQYAFCPGKELMIDIFMEEHQVASAEGRGSPSGSSIASSTKKTESPQPPSSGGAIDKIFESLNDFITPKIVKNIQTLYHFVITGEEAGEWFIDLKTGNGGSGKGKPAQKPDVEITINSQDAVKLFKGELKAATAFMSGKLKIKGDMTKAIKLDSVLVEAGEKVMSKL